MGDIETLPDEALDRLRQEAVAKLAGLADFTPGSFQVEWGRCGKPACHCAKPGDRGHGPSYSVMRWEAGRSRKRRVPVPMAEVIRQRVATWDEFQRVCRDLAEVNTEASRRLLLAGRPAAGAEKGGSKPGPTTSVG
jgi:hypothetical protein